MDTVYFMQQRLHNELIVYYMEKYGLTPDKAIEEHATLLDSRTEFYAKSLNELKYLLMLEQQNNMQEWKSQAIIY